MRAQLLLLTLGAALVGCSAMRGGNVPVEDTQAAERRTATRRARESICAAHPAVDRWEDRLRHERKRLRRILAKPEVDQVRRLVVNAGLPESLALIPILESTYRAHARSHDGGAGLWQLQKPTARRFGLVVKKSNDERLDPDRSTRAAIRYIRMLHWRFKSWPLTIAAYNAGEGRLYRALQARPKASVWELAEHEHIPHRTATYVSRFFALARLLETPPPC